MFVTRTYPSLLKITPGAMENKALRSTAKLAAAAALVLLYLSTYVIVMKLNSHILSPVELQASRPETDMYLP